MKDEHGNFVGSAIGHDQWHYKKCIEGWTPVNNPIIRCDEGKLKHDPTFHCIPPPPPLPPPPSPSPPPADCSTKTCSDTYTQFPPHIVVKDKDNNIVKDEHGGFHAHWGLGHDSMHFKHCLEGWTPVNDPVIKCESGELKHDPTFHCIPPPPPSPPPPPPPADCSTGECAKTYADLPKEVIVKDKPGNDPTGTVIKDHHGNFLGGSIGHEQKHYKSCLVGWTPVNDPVIYCESGVIRHDPTFHCIPPPPPSPPPPADCTSGTCASTYATFQPEVIVKDKDGNVVKDDHGTFFWHVFHGNPLGHGSEHRKECPPEWRPVGDPVIRCKEGSLEHDSSFHCIPPSPPPPPPPPPADCSTGTCQNAYSTFPPQVIVKDKDGNTVKPAVPGYVYTGPGLGHDEMHFKHCIEGWTPVNDPVIKCNEGVLLHDPSFHCIPPPPPSPPPPSPPPPPTTTLAPTTTTPRPCSAETCGATFAGFGPHVEVPDYQGGELTHGFVLHKECASGFMPKGDPVIHCEEGEIIHDPSFHCVPLTGHGSCWVWSDPHVVKFDGATSDFNIGDAPVHTLAKWRNGIVQSYRCPAKCGMEPSWYYPCGSTGVVAIAGKFRSTSDGKDHTIVIAKDTILVDGQAHDLGRAGYWQPATVPIGDDECTLSRYENPATVAVRKLAAGIALADGEAPPDTVKMPGDYTTTFECKSGAKISLWNWDESHMPTGYLMNTNVELPAADPCVAGVCLSDDDAEVCQTPLFQELWPKELLDDLKATCGRTVDTCGEGGAPQKDEVKPTASTPASTNWPTKPPAGDDSLYCNSACKSVWRTQTAKGTKDAGTCGAHIEWASKSIGRSAACQLVGTQAFTKECAVCATGAPAPNEGKPTPWQLAPSPPPPTPAKDEKPTYPFGGADQSAWLWGDPHVITFATDTYDYMNRGMQSFCTWDDFNGEKAHVEYYGCGVVCNKSPDPAHPHQWPCAESGAVALAVNLFGKQVAVLKGTVFVEGEDSMRLNPGDKTSFSCPKCPGNKRLTIEGAKVVNEEVNYIFRFGNGPPTLGDNVTISTWTLPETFAAGTSPNEVAKMPTKYLNNLKVRLGAPATKSAKGLCSAGPWWQMDYPSPVTMEYEPKAFPASLQQALSKLDSACAVGVKGHAPEKEEATSACDRNGVSVEEARASCLVAVGGYGQNIVGQCMIDYCSLGQDLGQMNSLVADNPFGCSKTPSSYCNPDGPSSTLCFLDPACSIPEEDLSVGIPDAGCHGHSTERPDLYDFCGRAACKSVWNKKTAVGTKHENTCGEHIVWASANKIGSLTDACELVGTQELTSECAVCKPVPCTPKRPKDCGSAAAGGLPMCRPCHATSVHSKPHDMVTCPTATARAARANAFAVSLLSQVRSRTERNHERSTSGSSSHALQAS